MRRRRPMAGNAGSCRAFRGEPPWPVAWRGVRRSRLRLEAAATSPAAFSSRQRWFARRQPPRGLCHVQVCKTLLTSPVLEQCAFEARLILREGTWCSCRQTYLLETVRPNTGEGWRPRRAPLPLGCRPQKRSASCSPLPRATNALRSALSSLKLTSGERGPDLAAGICLCRSMFVVDG